MSGATLTEFSPRDFRNAISSFATGVTIVTALDVNSEPVGMTASSFNSVSTEPPLVLWSVTKAALSASAFKAAQHFAIHVLASDQKELSNTFAQSGGDKFSKTGFELDQNDVPILPHIASRFDCTTWAVYEGGDHWIIVGEVQAITTSNKPGLVFGGGGYAVTAPLESLSLEKAGSSQADDLIESLLFYHLSRAYHQIGQQFHQAVRDSELTVAEWRICASLFGQTTRTLHDLVDRTFMDVDTLLDTVTVMAKAKLCTIQNSDAEVTVTGTQLGQKRVQHLFELADEQEQAALTKITGADVLSFKKILRQVVANTG